MTIRFRKFLQYMIYGSMLSVITVVLSAFGGTKKTNQPYSNTSNNPVEIPAAHADIPSVPTDGGGGDDGYDGDSSAGYDGGSGADCGDSDSGGECGP